jgi:hypothetical protein
MGEWRKTTWGLVLWTVLMVLWLATAVRGGFECDRETGTARAVCDAGASIGVSLGPSLVGVVWFVGFITLGLIWLASRPKRISR